jgi:rhodanese-related sulfurtransferase
MNKICPSKCPSLIASGNAVVLDIRESFEYDQAHIESLHIPMAEVVEHIENLKKYPQIIVMCQSGKRAEAMVNFLETEFNLTNLLLMEGGILGWKEKVDSSLKID